MSHRRPRGIVGDSPFAALTGVPDEIIERLSLGFASNGTAFCLYAPDDSIAYASPAFVEIWDVQPDARSFADVMRHCHAARSGAVIAGDDVDAWLAAADAKRRSVPERAFEVDIHDGRWFWLHEAAFDDGWVLATASDITSLKANEDTLRHWAETDALTGLRNRRHAMAQLDAMSAGSNPPDATLSMALLDIDHFKRINDRHGHDVGDRVLEHFAATARARMRRDDVLARVGGEEFLLIMRDARAGETALAVDRLRKEIAQSWPLGNGVLRYTVSAGIAERRCGETGHQLYKRADIALYRAKRAGRNRIETDLTGTQARGIAA